jgi:DNA-binding transcriptional LysR family regulator
LLISTLREPDPCRIIRHAAALDELISLVGAGWGVLLALEGATGLAYPGVTFREVHDEGPSRLEFRAFWRATNQNPSLQPFLAMLRERYPDIAAEQAFASADRTLGLPAQTSDPSP